MALIHQVTRYSFKEPTRISEHVYLQLKQKLQNDPNFSLLDTTDTITKKFSRLFKFLLGAAASVGVLLIIFLLGEELGDNGFIIFIGVVAMLWTIFGFIIFILSLTELTSYAGYLRRKRSYFTDMEDSIRKSKGFTDFSSSFYR